MADTIDVTAELAASKARREATIASGATKRLEVRDPDARRKIAQQMAARKPPRKRAAEISPPPQAPAESPPVEAIPVAPAPRESRWDAVWQRLLAGETVTIEGPPSLCDSGRVILQKRAKAIGRVVGSSAKAGQLASVWLKPEGAEPRAPRGERKPRPSRAKVEAPVVEAPAAIQPTTTPLGAQLVAEIERLEADVAALRRALEILERRQ